MKYRLLIAVALTALTFPAVAQNSQRPAPPSFNSMYDSVIINNNTIPVSYYPYALPKRDSLIYDSRKNYKHDDLKLLLDGAHYTDREKINFIRAAINDGSKDIFRRVEMDAIDYWHTNAQAQLLMLGYFIKPDADQSNDPAIHFRYLDFVTCNGLPGTADMIEEYIKNRPLQTVRYPHEFKLVHRLIQAGNEKSALALLQVLVAEYTGNNETYYSSWGERDEDRNVFDWLCFSNNPAIRTQATQLLWTFLDKAIEEEPFYLGLYLDEKRTLQCLHKKFQWYTTAELGKAPARLKKGAYPEEAPSLTSSYFRFMFYYALWLGKTTGKQLWAEFMNRLPYWDYYKGGMRSTYQARILLEIFKDSSITQKERQQMLFDIKISEVDFDDLHRYNASCRPGYGAYDNLMRTYLELVRQAYPDGNIATEDSTRLYLQHIKRPSYGYEPWVNHDADLSNGLADLQQLGVAPLQPNLPDYWTFKWAQPRYRSVHHLTSGAAGWISRFDPPYEHSPVSSTTLFTLHFAPLLAKIGITDIEVQEIKSNIPNQHPNQLFVRSKEAICTREYIGTAYGIQQVQMLAKMINLLLMKKNINHRLVEIEADKYSAAYGLLEPEKARAFFTKYKQDSKELNKVAMLLE